MSMVKKETGCVGLKNQGATCYLNSLLQTLFHIPYFRKVVYQIPTTENNPSRSISLALQSLFYKLQYNDTSVLTEELTKSFGWTKHDSFKEQDVHLFNLKHSGILEAEMRGTVVEGTIQQLFEGHMSNLITYNEMKMCKMVAEEPFHDIQLNVSGFWDIYASIDEYVAVAEMGIDNDIQNKTLFKVFPPILKLLLKRTGYTQNTGAMFKVNDRFEFPLQLDLDRKNGKYLSLDADRSVRNLCTRHSVLVHSGAGLEGGHYYVYIRPILSDQWFKFDDERVTKVDMKSALEEQYGGDESNSGFDKVPSTAYMLFYIRDAEKEKIICNVDEKDIPEHLREMLKKKQEENNLVSSTPPAASLQIVKTLPPSGDYHPKKSGHDSPGEQASTLPDHTTRPLSPIIRNLTTTK